MRVDLLLYAIPVFFILIGVELLITKIKGKDFYSFSDSIADLSCGIAQTTLDVFIKVAMLAGYIFVYNNFRFFELSDTSVWTWVFSFFALDFLYYWFHRFSHEINVIWGSHAPHHQSEEFNLTVALRQGSFQPVFSAVFYWPLALLGVSPVVFLVQGQISLIYQFWIHTRLIGRLGFLELFMNTPSHHRVHHGKNPKYIDRNHAGILIIWDKMFGTFQLEEEEVVYGTVKSFESRNPIYAAFEHWINVAKLSWEAPHWDDKVRVWFMEPGWMPRGLGPQRPIPEVDARSYEKFRPKAPLTLNLYVLAQFIPAVALSVFLMTNEARLGSTDKLIAGGLVFVSLLNFGGILETKRWAFRAELGRLLFILFAVFQYSPRVDVRIAATIAVASMLIFFGGHREAFKRERDPSEIRYAA